jgi:tetratricopeptide (TPR) repeat protein
VAILGFWNWSKANGRNPRGAQLSGMLTTELAAGNRIRIVNGEDVARMKHDLVLPDVDTYSFKTRARIGAYLEADHLVIGFYSETEPGQIRVDMRLQDTIQDNPDFVFPEMDSREEIGTLVGRIGEKLRDRLGAGELSDADRAAIKAAIPSTPRNVPLYFGGLARLQEFGNLHAPKAPLQEVVGSEPDFPLAHMALAMTWLGLGYETKAKVEADLAFKYSGKLSGVDRQLVEARYLEISDKWDLAANVYQDLFKTYPDNLDYGLGLVYALAGAENRQNALSTLAGLKNLLPGENESPRIDLAEAAVADRWFDGQVEFEAATRAKMKAQALGAVLQEAKALQYECLGLQKLADLEMALDACRKSQSKFNNAGDVGNGAESLKIVGGILSDLGEFEEARQASEQALRVFANLGNNSKAAGCMNEIGIVLDSQGELSASQKWYEKALDLYLTIDDKLKQSAELHNIGGLLLRKGNLDPALKMYLQSIDLDQKLHHGDFESGSWENIGYIYFLRGDIANALTMLDRAEPLLSKNSDPDKRSSILTT